MHMLSNLKKISDIDVKFRNAFIGEARFLELSVGENKYFLTSLCHLSVLNEIFFKRLYTLTTAIHFTNSAGMKNRKPRRNASTGFKNIISQIVPMSNSSTKQKNTLLATVYTFFFMFGFIRI